MNYAVWGSELSPFTLKVLRTMRHARVPLRFLPTQGSWSENIRCLWRLSKLKSGRLPMTYPVLTEDDELPLVPYVFGEDGSNLYDSTAIAEWFDRGLPPERRLLPAEPVAAFLARLIDDYADEFLLYVVHHNRWVVSRADNDAGARLAHEYRSLIGPLQRPFAAWFSHRQVRRLPYLFSMEQTRPLLDEAFARVLDVLETLLSQRRFILGERFTLADAAIYGQLGMNLADPSACALIRQRRKLHAWLLALHGSEPEPIASGDALALDGALMPLLGEIFRTYVPLMKQNARAFEALRASGATRFNEAAFDRGEAMYDGVLEGRPFRHVAKRFQARVWKDCVARWRALEPAAQARVAALLPPGASFE